jgi:hypothetical protein
MRAYGTPMNTTVTGIIQHSEYSSLKELEIGEDCLPSHLTFRVLRGNHSMTIRQLRHFTQLRALRLRGAIDISRHVTEEAVSS